jgi:hypothetical protein
VRVHVRARVRVCALGLIKARTCQARYISGVKTLAAGCASLWTLHIATWSTDSFDIAGVHSSQAASFEEEIGGKKQGGGGHGKPYKSFTFASASGGWGTPRPPGPLTEIEDRRACDSDRRVAVNNIQVILVCGRPGDRGGCLGAKVQSVF